MKFLKIFILCTLVSSALACKKDEPAEAPVEEKAEELEPAPEPEEPEPKKFGQAWANADEAARTAAFDDPSKLRGLLTYSVVRSSTPEPEGTEVGPYQLAVANDKTRDFNRAAGIGMRRLRSVFVQQARVHQGQDLATICRSECQQMALNAAFSKVAGGPLFAEDGSANPEPLQKLFTALYVEPDASLLGLQARDIYTLVRPAAREITGVYAGLKEIGFKDVSEAFDTALAENPEPETGVNTGLLKFYKRYTNLEGVAQKAGLEQDSSHWTAVGFWMRRIKEGTADVFASFANKTLKDYDPDWHTKHFGAGDE